MFMKCLDITSHHLSLTRTHKAYMLYTSINPRCTLRPACRKAPVMTFSPENSSNSWMSWAVFCFLSHIRKSVDLYYPSMNLIFAKASVSTPRYRRVLFTQLSDVISQVQPQGISSQYIRRTYAYMAITNQHALSLDCMQAARGLELQVARGLQRPEHSTVPAKGH